MNGLWLLQLKEAGWMSKGARKDLLAAGRDFMADGKVEVPQRQLQGCLRGEEYSLIEA